MTEKELRNSVATFLNPYKGIAEGSTQHKELISIFNDSGLCTRYKMTVNDAWCAMAVSDCFIATGLTDIFPCVECSCSKMVELAKTAGIWEESDSLVPSIADVVLYDWDDSGKGDNTGNPDHVGVVQSVSGNKFVVIEGNKSDTVGTREMEVDGQYIRGFIVPKYASAATSSSSTKKTVDELAVEVINGDWGNGDDRKKALTDAGYDYDAVQAKVNEMLKGTTSSSTSSSSSSSKSTSSSSSSSTSSSSTPSYTVGKTYTTQVDHLAVRSGAGTSYSKKTKSQLTSDGQKHAYDDGCLKKGTTVTCKATKTVSGNVWMQIPSGWVAAYYDGSKYVK